MSSQAHEQTERPRLEHRLDSGVLVLAPSGTWRIKTVNEIHRLDGRGVSEAVIDGNALAGLDTAGAVLLIKTATSSGASLDRVSFRNLKEEQKTIFELIAAKLRTSEAPAEAEVPLSRIASLGAWTIENFQRTAQFIQFIGLAAAELARAVLNPAVLRKKELFIQLERAGIRAVPITSLVIFLIGLVIAYVFASESEKYGASTFIAEAVGTGICRELSPVLAAIICAGRSGSAFTAQIGAMKLSQEIDAITTLGLSPIQVLVIPRLVALAFTLPVLVLIGDMAGIAGGMSVGWMSLDIAPSTFADRIRTIMPMRFIWLGVVKAPVFALVVGMIACYRGLQSESNARSVGLSTTATVVQSIVAILLVDAAFAILFQELGW